MRNLITTLTLALYAVAATADSSLEARQGTTSLTGITCGSTTYTKQQVDAAVAEGCRLHGFGRQLGDNRYPHQFNNREGLVFAAAGPYQEFPILANRLLYAGSKSPGPDRVVFNPNLKGECVYVGAMTHTGASGNGFLSCAENSGSAGAGAATTSLTTLSGTLKPTSTSVSSSSRTSTSTSTSSAAATTSANPNGAQGLLAGTGGQGVVAVGVVAGLLLL